MCPRCADGAPLLDATPTQGIARAAEHDGEEADAVVAADAAELVRDLPRDETAAGEEQTQPDAGPVRQGDQDVQKRSEQCKSRMLVVAAALSM